jgi:hypothetical protein
MRTAHKQCSRTADPPSSSILLILSQDGRHSLNTCRGEGRRLAEEKIGRITIGVRNNNPFGDVLAANSGFPRATPNRPVNRQPVCMA